MWCYTIVYVHLSFKNKKNIPPNYIMGLVIEGTHSTAIHNSVWNEYKCMCEMDAQSVWLWLWICLHHVPHFVCLVSTPPFQEAILAWQEKACLTPRLVRLYRTRQRDVLPWHRWHDACHPSAVSLPFNDVVLCVGPLLYFLPSLLLGLWWGAVIYNKWLGGNSSNMICVGAHKTSPSVTLKEWNGRAVLVRLPLSHCRDHKCV